LCDRGVSANKLSRSAIMFVNPYGKRLRFHYFRTSALGSNRLSSIQKKIAK
jgi:hypothetical protein